MNFVYNMYVLYIHSHNEIVDTPMWLVWLRGGGLIAAVIYSSAVVYLTLGWRGWQNMLMCGLMVYLQCIIRESVDSLCRDDADIAMPPYIRKA